MTVDEAFKTLEISRELATKDTIKASYRRLASKYHPDRNPDGLAMMQRVNAANELLSGMSYDVNSRSSVINVGKIRILKERDRTIVSGNTFPFKKVLKSCGFKWRPEDKSWWRYGTCPIEDYLVK